ncbi:MAG: hypothetical protein ABWK05_06420 [Pyrobaculum sp.]
MLSELYKSGKIKQDALGVLAKTVICIKTGCLATGQDVLIGNVTLQLAEAIVIAPRSPKPQSREPVKRQAPQKAPQEKKTSKPVQEAAKPPKTEPPREEQRGREPTKAETQWGGLVSLLSNEAKVDAQKADLVLTSLLNYLSVYPSVGVIRLVEDVSRLAKTDQRVVRTALEILRSAEVVDLREEGVVNLKKRIKKGEIPL